MEEMPGITRVNRLYNSPPVSARKARDGKPARKARPARTGRLPVGKSEFYQDIVLKSEDDPFIPGTNVRRLELIHLY
jgi:hypothetical protein